MDTFGTGLLILFVCFYAGPHAAKTPRQTCFKHNFWSFHFFDIMDSSASGWPNFNTHCKVKRGLLLSGVSQIPSSFGKQGGGGGSFLTFIIIRLKVRFGINVGHGVRVSHWGKGARVEGAMCWGERAFEFSTRKILE